MREREREREGEGERERDGARKKTERVCGGQRGRERAAAHTRSPAAFHRPPHPNPLRNSARYIPVHLRKLALLHRRTPQDPPTPTLTLFNTWPEGSLAAEELRWQASSRTSVMMGGSSV